MRLFLKATPPGRALRTPQGPAAPKALACHPPWPSQPVNGSGATAQFLLLARQLSWGCLEWGSLLQPRGEMGTLGFVMLGYAHSVGQT